VAAAADVANGDGGAAAMEPLAVSAHSRPSSCWQYTAWSSSGNTSVVDLPVDSSEITRPSRSAGSADATTLHTGSTKRWCTTTSWPPAFTSPQSTRSVNSQNLRCFATRLQSHTRSGTTTTDSDGGGDGKGDIGDEDGDGTRGRDNA
jgi:hypothetical protein